MYMYMYIIISYTYVFSDSCNQTKPMNDQLRGVNWALLTRRSWAISDIQDLLCLINVIQ